MTPNETHHDIPLGQTSLDLQIEFATDRIASEVRGTFNRETVQRVFLDSLEAFRDSRIQAYVPLLAERATREKLRTLAHTAENPSRVARILFLCTHNAGRSQMALGWARLLGGDRLEVYSGGSEPVSEINPMAIEAMREVGIDISGEQPKRWTDERVRDVDVVVTMGCGDACAVYPGVKYVDWEVEDPAGQELEAVRAIRDDVGRRVRALLDELGLEASPDLWGHKMQSG